MVYQIEKFIKMNFPVLPQYVEPEINAYWLK